MESKSDTGIGNGPVINMVRVPITEGQEIQRLDEKRKNGNGEIQRRIKNIPVLEERRLLALERHIKRKRRRRPYVKKKMKSSDKTEHQLDKTMTATNEKMPEIHGNRMAVSEKNEEKQTNLLTTNELIENFEVQSTKMEVGEDKQQSVQFDKLVKYLLDGVKSEIIIKVEEGLKSLGEVQQWKVEEESQIKQDDGDVMEVKQEDEQFTFFNFQGEGQHFDKAKDNDNQIVDIGNENADQSFNTSSTGSKERKPPDPELESVKTNQLITHDRGDGKTGFNGRNKEEETSA